MPKTNILDFIKYWKKPTLEAKFSEKTLTNKLQLFFELLSVLAVTAFLANLITTFLIGLTDLNLQDQYLLLESFAETPLWEVFLTAVVIGPFVEEVAFRLFLSKIKWQFYLGLIVLLVNLNFFVSFLGLQLTGISLQSLNFVILGLGLGFIFGDYISFLRTKKTSFYFGPKSYQFWIIFSTITFALLHWMNYKNITQVGAWIFLLVIPQLLAGMVFTFFRTQFNFWWGFLSHAAYNFIFSFSVLISLQIQRSGLDVDELIADNKLFETLPDNIKFLIFANSLVYLAVIITAFITLYRVVFGKKIEKPEVLES